MMTTQIVANKHRELKQVETICKYILEKNNSEVDNYTRDVYLQVCDEDLYNSLDLTYTICDWQYENATVDQVVHIVDKIIEIIREININTTQHISMTGINFKEMMQVYEAYTEDSLEIQEKYASKHGRSRYGNN